MRAIVALTVSVGLLGAAGQVAAQTVAPTSTPAPNSAPTATPGPSFAAKPAPSSGPTSTPAPTAAPASTPAPAPKTAPTGPILSAFRVGIWDAGAFASPGTNTFSYCTGVATYNNGVTMAFVLSNTFQWGIALIDPIWNLSMGASYPIALSIDSAVSGTATATAIGTSEVLIPLNPTVALFKTFMEGEKLRVEAASDTYTFDLTNTSEMLPDLLKCVEAYAGAAPANSNPFVATSN